MQPESNSEATDVTTSAPVTTDAPAAQQDSAASDSSSQDTKDLEVVYDGAPVPIEGETIETQEDAGDAADKQNGDSADGQGSESKDVKTEDQPREEKKRGRDTRIQQLVANEKTYKDIIRSLNPDYDIEAAVQGGRAEADARMDAFEHDKARTDLAQSVNQLNTDLQQQTEDLISDYPFMDTTKSDRTEAEVAQADELMDMWFEAAQPEFLTDSNNKIVVDGNGDPVFKSVKIPLYQFVNKIMKFGETRIAAATASAERTGQKNAEQKLAAVEIPGGTKPSTGSSKSDASLSAAEYAAKYNIPTV